MIKRITTTLLSFLIAGAVFAGKGLEIKITVKGLENSKMIFAPVGADKSALTNTIAFDSKGTAEIKEKEAPQPGVYMAVFPTLNNQYFKFIINNEPKFSLTTEASDLLGHMEVKGSNENKVLYEDIARLRVFQAKFDSLNHAWRGTKDSLAKPVLKSQLKALVADENAATAGLASANANLMVSKVIADKSEFEEPAALGGDGMHIKLDVKGLECSTLILANYYGDKQYVKDTFTFDRQGTVILKADTMLPGGVYLAVFPDLGNKYYEFVIAEKQFGLSTDTNDLAGHMKITNSLENKLFYEDMKFLSKTKETSDSLVKLYKGAKDPKDKEAFKQQLQDLDKNVKDKRNNVINQYPTLFYAKMLKSMKDPEVPEAPRDASGKITDSTWQWRYYKAHYWDNVDLMDDRLLRCPVFHNKLKTFMTQTVVQIPDSINVGGDELLAKTDMKGEMYRYVITYIFNEMANSKIMGFDACYVHFGKNYFCKGLCPWVDSTKLFKICDRVNRLEPVLVGKPAQRLTLPLDSNETRYAALYDLKAKYTILVFWDPDCGHCKKELPVLIDAYHDLKKKGIDVAGYSAAIMEIENYKDWVEFIQKNNLDWTNACDARRHNNFRFEWDIQSTPQIYILDKDKVIKARRIGADQVEDYILHLENPSYRGKLINTVKDDDKQEGTE